MDRQLLGGLIGAAEAFGGLGTERWRHAGTFVGDGEDDVGPVAAGGLTGVQGDAAGPVTDRVVDEVAQCAVEQEAVGVDELGDGSVGEDGPVVVLAEQPAGPCSVKFEWPRVSEFGWPQHAPS